MANALPCANRFERANTHGGVHHDERPGTDVPGWLDVRRYLRRDGGVTWTRRTMLPLTTSRGCVTA